jgi:hypothetical protein
MQLQTSMRVSGMQESLEILHPTTRIEWIPHIRPTFLVALPGFGGIQWEYLWNVEIVHYRSTGSHAIYRSTRPSSCLCLSIYPLTHLLEVHTSNHQNTRNGAFSRLHRQWHCCLDQLGCVDCWSRLRWSIPAPLPAEDGLQMQGSRQCKRTWRVSLFSQDFPIYYAHTY